MAPTTTATSRAPRRAGPRPGAGRACFTAHAPCRAPRCDKCSLASRHQPEPSNQSALASRRRLLRKRYRCPSTGSRPMRRTAPASASNDPRMSSGSTATNTRTVGGRLSTPAAPRALDVASRPKRRRRTRAGHHRPPERSVPCPPPLRWGLPAGRARQAHAVTVALVEPARSVARYSSSMRGGSVHRCRELAPTPRHSARPAPPHAETTPPHARPRPSVRLPIATSVLRSSLNPTSPGVIPA
jgi:hypothetical protein